MTPTLFYGTIGLTLAVATHAFCQIPNPAVQYHVALAAIIALFGYFLTVRLLPSLQVFLFKRGLKGRDLGRIGRPDQDEEIPSAVGVIAGVICMLLIIILQTFDVKTAPVLANYNAALQSMCFMLLLGFIDDVVDLPWRFKLVLPPLGSLPLLSSYTGSTSIAIPSPLQNLFWLDDSTPTGLTEFLGFLGVTNVTMGVLGVGFLYYVYMAMLSTFCTNAINIYAGINGLEVGQSIVIAVTIVICNLYQLQYAEDTTHPHMISILILLCFIATSLALLKYNWYPAQNFVGDTYCYFAGVTFAVVGILGHFSKTVILFLVPQIINFLYSCPQLFKIYPCPRHRLPGVNKDGLRVPSTFDIVDKEGKVIATKDNMTLINLVLRFTGPISEEHITTVLLFIQALCGAAVVVLRFYVAE